MLPSFGIEMLPVIAEGNDKSAFGIKKSADIKVTLGVQVQNYITCARKTFTLRGRYVVGYG